MTRRHSVDASVVEHMLTSSRRFTSNKDEDEAFAGLLVARRRQGARSATLVARALLDEIRARRDDNLVLRPAHPTRRTWYAPRTRRKTLDFPGDMRL